MSDTVVKCVTEPCVTACPDVKVLVHPPPLCLTLPGVSLTTDPSQCLVETQSSCLTNGSDGCPPAMVTKSSGVRAISGGDTPCCTTTCPDSQLLIYPPPICIIVPGAVLTSYPNECLIETSSPCATSNGHPHVLTGSPSASDGSLAPHHLPRSASLPGDLDRGPCCLAQGASHRVTICPPPIEVTIPGPVLEMAADECVVEVHNPCESGGAITSGAQSGIQTLRARAQACTTVHGEVDAPSCVTQGPAMTVVIHPPPFDIDVPGPVLKSFPESCQVTPVCSGTPQPAVQSGCAPQALCGATTSTGFNPALCAMKRPLPDIRRPARPWAEMYSRSITPRSVLTQRPLFSRYRSSYQPAY